METVNNLASAASRAIWGESATNGVEKNETNGQEPLSGETGNVEAGEPYDKGNAEPTSTPAEPKTVNPTPPTTEESKISTLTSNPKVTDTTAIKEADKPSDAEPVAASLSAPLETKGQQSSQLPTEVPLPEEHDIVKETKEGADGAVAVETSGAGSTTLEKEARDSGIDIAKAEDGPQKETAVNGTGELDVKSSEMKADVGDLDATNTSASKEADREFHPPVDYGWVEANDIGLLKENGVHTEPTAATSPIDTEEVGKDEKGGKMRMRDKIKEKLHIGHKDKD